MDVIKLRRKRDESRAPAAISWIEWMRRWNGVGMSPEGRIGLLTTGMKLDALDAQSTGDRLVLYLVEADDFAARRRNTGDGSDDDYRREFARIERTTAAIEALNHYVFRDESTFETALWVEHLGSSTEPLEELLKFFGPADGGSGLRNYPPELTSDAERVAATEFAADLAITVVRVLPYPGMFYIQDANRPRIERLVFDVLIAIGQIDLLTGLELELTTGLKQLLNEHRQSVRP